MCGDIYMYMHFFLIFRSIFAFMYFTLVKILNFQKYVKMFQNILDLNLIEISLTPWAARIDWTDLVGMLPYTFPKLWLPKKDALF